MKLVEFHDDVDLWIFLINGGTVVEKQGPERKEIRLDNGMKTYVKTGESAKNCLLSYDAWLAKYTDDHFQTPR